MLAGTDDHLTRLSPVILNLENMGLTHLESEIRVYKKTFAIVWQCLKSFSVWQMNKEGKWAVSVA